MAEPMLNTIAALLRASGADAWELTDVQERGWEFYLIRHRLDQHRVRLVEHITVKVYRRSEDGRFLGAASDEIPPTASPAEAEQTIARLLDRAAYVRNPAYTLNRPEPGEAPAPAEEPDVAAISRDFLGVLGSLPETATEDLNSCEIFVSAIRRRFLNSEGIDVTSVYPSSMAEAVVNARDGGHEIELYRMYRSGACDREGLLRSLAETMTVGRDKLSARQTPALGRAKVLLSTDAACEVYNWFIFRMSAGMQVRKLSDWAEGRPVADRFDGDRVTVEGVTSLPNSSENAAYDEEGARIFPSVLVRDGVAGKAWGSRQFSQYLGLERACIYGNFAVSGGTADTEALRAACDLEIVEFSDFQVDPVNGDIAGEIRLAYWHDADRIVPVSGGSVSGRMGELVRTMRMTAERRQYNSMLIPAATLLDGAVIAGG